MNIQDTWKKIKKPSQIISGFVVLRALTGFLGERHQSGWWDVNFLDQCMNRTSEKKICESIPQLTPGWTEDCGLYDSTPSKEDIGNRAKFRAEIDAYVAHLYSLSRDEFAYILDTFPVLKRKEVKAFGEFMSKRKCLEEYDRIGRIINWE